ncbi:hypothetical protein FBB35_12805 [Nostoc sp. TCL240-02]|nr:hypothetical protein FBB35_12805 [Nostoc sp. TCL240-02]
MRSKPKRESFRDWGWRRDRGKDAEERNFPSPSPFPFPFPLPLPPAPFPPFPNHEIWCCCFSRF